MRNLKKILLCAGVNFRKWIVTPRMYVVLAVLVIFAYYTFAGVHRIEEYLGVESSPWAFPFFMTMPTMFIIIGGLTTLFYCNAPFADRHMPFLVIRLGRRSWILGQLLYIYLSGFVYTACILLLSVVMLLPGIDFTTDWGPLMYTLAGSQSEILEQAGAQISFIPHGELLALLTPIQAVALSFLLFWLVSVFIGVLICCFHIVLGRMSGIFAAGAFICVAYFSVYLGTISIGSWLLYLSPLSWSSLYSLDWHHTGAVPSPTYAIVCLVVAIVVLSIVSVVMFCRKDLEIQEGEF